MNDPRITTLARWTMLLLTVAVMVSPAAAKDETPAEKQARLKQEAQANLNKARQRLQSARQQAGTAQADVNRFTGQIPPAENAANAAKQAYETARLEEGTITQRLKAEIETDARPRIVRDRLNAATQAEQKRRAELMPDIVKSKEHMELVAVLEATEKTLASLQEQSSADPKARVDAAQKLMTDRNAVDTHIDAQLLKDQFYRDVKKELDEAKREAQELEREIANKIESNPDRAFATKRAAEAKIAADSKRRTLEDTRRSLNSANNRLNTAQREVAKQDQEVRTYAAQAGVKP